ncbi:MAG: hypothetical protein LAT76_07835 [Schleiferiaceae bacterium]|nr:hypothetical protein [Schleiferiaceae bacterium]
MSNALKVVDSLIEKTETLTQKYELVCRENEVLQDKIQHYHNDMKSQREHIDHLETEIRQLKIANGMLGSKETAGVAKSKINEIMREIDRCIALLNE